MWLLQQRGVACAGTPKGASLGTTAHICVFSKEVSTESDLGSVYLEAQAVTGRRQLPREELCASGNGWL